MSFLNAKPQIGNPLVADRIEHRPHDPRGEAGPLVVVHPHHLLPVLGHLGQPEMLAQVDQVQDVFLEAGTAEADRRFQELGADAAVRADGVRHFVHVRTGRFAQGRDRVDRRHALSQERVGGQLRQLGAPEVRRQDPFARDPVGVNRRQRLHGLGRLAADQHAIGVQQVLDGGAFGQELGVAQHVERRFAVTSAPGCAASPRPCAPGSVDFSTTILCPRATRAIVRHISRRTPGSPLGPPRSQTSWWAC